MERPEIFHLLWQGERVNLRGSVLGRQRETLSDSKSFDQQQHPATYPGSQCLLDVCFHCKAKRLAGKALCHKNSLLEACRLPFRTSMFLKNQHVGLPNAVEEDDAYSNWHPSLVLVLKIAVCSCHDDPCPKIAFILLRLSSGMNK